MMESASLERIGAFKHCLFHEIPRAYGVWLGGSWVAHEHHVSIRPTGIVSFSDVDYASDLDNLEEIHQDIRLRVFDSAKQVGILLLGDVSLRYRVELDALWKLPDVVSGEYSHLIREHFICFWVFVACAEAALAYAEECTVQGWGQYQITKFFLRLWRTLAIADGCQVHSWAESLHYAEQWLSPDFCQAALRIKKGDEEVEDWSAFVEANRVALIENLSWMDYKSENHRLVVDAITEVTCRVEFDFVINFFQYLRLAKPFAVSFTSRMAAMTRLQYKGKKICQRPLHFCF